MKNTKKFDYFQAFIEFSEKAVEASKMLNDCFKNFSPDKVSDYMDKIHAKEHEADMIKHTVIEHLSREFVAPIEREDIIALVSQFDDVVDCIDEVVRKLGIYHVKAMRADAPRFTELLVKMCENMNGLCKEFANFKKSTSIKEQLIAINSIESEADTLHSSAISELFGNDSTDIKEIVIWQRIYNELEECFDSGEHTAEVVESVILKND